MNPKAEELVNQVCEVCPLPASAARVMELSRSKEADVREITRVLSSDPAMATEVLRIANSAAYARAQKIADLGQAVMSIGLRELHDMAAAMALLAAFRSDAELALELHDSSVLSGNIARLLAKDLGLGDPGRAFLCGLLSEVGAMACLSVDGKGFLDVWEYSQGDWKARVRLERQRYSATSFEIGGGLLRRNRIPDEIADAVACGPDTEGDAFSALGRVTAFSRLAGLAILRAREMEDPSLLAEELPADLHACGIEGLGAAEVLDLCGRAAGSSG